MQGCFIGLGEKKGDMHMHAYCLFLNEIIIL